MKAVPPVARLIIGCATLLCCASTLADAQARAFSPMAADPGWVRPHRHFNFGGLTFDFTYGYWRYGSYAERLADCSDRRAYCLTSGVFGVALPRRCADVAAGRWAAGDIRTEIVFREVRPPSIHEPGTGTTLYLGSAARPHQLFVYDPGLGLKGLYWDERRQVDFMAMAREGRLDAWLRGSREVVGRYYFPLTTLATVGACLR